jgi:uncharacterized protein DUF6225
MSESTEELYRHEVTELTVGALRAAIVDLPDDAPILVHVAEEPGGDVCDTQVVYQVFEDCGVLGISCEFPTGDYYRTRR